MAKKTYHPRKGWITIKEKGPGKDNKAPDPVKKGKKEVNDGHNS